MSYQRRHGQWVELWPQRVTLDRRGNRVVRVNMEEEPIRTRAFLTQDRSNRAEVPGQLEVNVYQMIVRHDLEDIGIWSRVRWDNKFWDVVSPAAYHHGTRQTRHKTFLIRERPVLGHKDGEF